MENENDVLGLRTVDKTKRSADAQVFDGYDYYDDTDENSELFGGDNIYSNEDLFDGYDQYDGNLELFGGDIYDSDDSVGNREGDSDDVRLIQLGVVAWGIGCGREGLPSVYSSVASARCWLDQVMSCYQPTSGTSDSGDREREISSVSHLDAFSSEEADRFALCPLVPGLCRRIQRGAMRSLGTEGGGTTGRLWMQTKTQTKRIS